MSNLPELFIVQLFQLTFVIAIALLIDRLLVRSQKHRLRYIVWTFVLVKALVPPIVASPTGLFSIAQSRTEVRMDCDAVITSGWANHFQQWVIDHTFVVVLSVGLWLSGVAVLVAWTIYRMRLMAADRAEDEAQQFRCEQMVQQECRRLMIAKVPQVRLSQANYGPAVYGLFRPIVVIPLNVLEQLEDSDLRPIITHELLHVRRRDTWVGMLQLSAAIVWWFHPLVWLAIRRLSNALEYVTDDDVVELAGVDEHKYANSLLSVIEAGFAATPAVGTLGVFSCEVTEERIRRLINRETTPVSRLRPILLAMFLALTLIPGRGLNMVQTLANASSSNPVIAR